MGHASNARVVRASQLLTGMGDLNAEYDPKNVYSNSEHSESKDDAATTKETPEPLTVFALTTDNTTESDFDSICNQCISSKQTRVVNRRKPMTKVKEKLEEIHVDLWGPHNPPLLSSKTYAAILLDAKTRKTWVKYLRSKDEFVDVFQTWLPKVENESKTSIKALRADGG